MRTFLTGTLLLVALLAAVPAPRSDADRHFGLAKSTPEADATVASPAEVRLWFTEVPEEGTVSIQVVEAMDRGVHVDDVVQDADDGRVFSVELHGTLPAGTYTVSWRGMGSDGHVVRDTFQFTVGVS